MSYRKLPLLVLVVAVLVTGTASETDATVASRRDQMLSLLNQTRRSHGLPILRLNLALSRTAQSHSRAMADRNTLFHTSNLWAAVRAFGPSTWGENVGYAPWLRRLRALWMQSGGHRQNILNPRFRWIGIGVVRARGVFWVTTIFYGG
jgi:uncharacterized protein YkwD